MADTTTATPLDPELDELRALASGSGLAPLVEIEPSEARQRIAAGHRLCSAGPNLLHVEGRTVRHGGRSVPVRRYAAADTSGPTLVYVHGGGWVTGDLDYSDEFCRFLARDAGCTVVSVNYPLAPEAVFPESLDAVSAAIRWALAEATGPIAVGGDSAGANLVAAAVHQLGARATELAFQLLLYPVVDHDSTRGPYRLREKAFPIGAPDMAWFFDHYVPDPRDRDDPRVSPLRAPDFAHQPRTHVVVAGHDPLHDEGIAYAARVESAGRTATLRDYPALCHGFLRFTGASAAARTARDEIVATTAGLFREVTRKSVNNDYDSQALEDSSRAHYQGEALP